MPLQATSGAASYDAFGGGVAAEPIYIEDVFSTSLYTGNGSTQTITNGVDLAGEGGLVWIKDRNGGRAHVLTDTARGAGNTLCTNLTNANEYDITRLSAFTSSGFSIGNDLRVNDSGGSTYASWTFRKQPKFFDVVTYTGTGANRTIAHSLGSVPGCIIVKRTDTTANWLVYHRSLANTQYLRLNLTNSAATASTLWNSTTPTDTVFSLGTEVAVNASGGTYVAYVFAHDAGGFGLTGTDNVISCGSFTTDGSGNATVDLGYEPQWLLYKASSGTGDWYIVDNMRGMPTEGAGDGRFVYANLSDAEDIINNLRPTATGFKAVSVATSQTRIYIAIRRGPMKVPTTGTSVLGLSARTGTGANATVTGGAGVTDLAIIKNRGDTTNWAWTPRLTGTGYLSSNANNAEIAAGTTILQANPWDVMDGVKVGTSSNMTNASSKTFINYLIDRAPGFMDVVCYTGNGSFGRSVPHNLTVVPELMIVKSRTTGGWRVYAAALNSISEGLTLQLNTTAQADFNGNFFGIPTSSSIILNDSGAATSNQSSVTYVAYLFASAPGVSKCGLYTGNGSSQTINCGFTAGSRFVLIKRTDSTGDWYVWDSARGIVAGNDPHLSLNTTAAEVTTDDSVDTDSTGFVVNQVAATNVNVSSATYIFLAIA
jgi:hypothetical protein